LLIHIPLLPSYKLPDRSKLLAYLSLNFIPVLRIIARNKRQKNIVFLWKQESHAEEWSDPGLRKRPTDRGN
jgi:hypothetical protein